MKRGRQIIRDQSGFTLVELLVVIIVLGLLVGLVGPRLWGQVSKSKQATARAQIELLGSSLDQYRLDNGSYPTNLEELQQKPATAANWNGPYLKKDVPLDPWGRAYVYESPGQHGDYDLYSYGSDGAPGGDSDARDVASW